MMAVRAAVRVTVQAAAMVASVSAAPLGAQGGTDVWVAELRGNGSVLEMGRPRNVTNRAGYDNQPSFTPDGRFLLFTSIRADEQADIWRVALTGGEATPFIATPESEYSAQAMPDGSGVSVIRVELDSTQRLWAFDWQGQAQRALVPRLKPVGYHVWVGEDNIGAFVLSQPTNDVPNALVLMNPLTDRVDTLARRIERAFARVPGRDAFTFVQRVDTTTVVSEVDVRTRTLRRVFTGPRGLEYHVWLPDGSMLITGGGMIYRWVDARLWPFVDLRTYGIQNVSRIALSPDGRTIAFVASDPTP